MTASSDRASHQKAHGAPKSDHQPQAESAGGESDSRPTPVHHAPQVKPEDEPKGQPNSDRFRTEQAARPAKGRH
ncbi:hypothetical protein [Acidisoma silvae]|uniref:Uncharacterized protein n=1 Tax=Acidisoma silvae TaxID=2802396 RepID=A0A964E001_9PROT|nr:hypothetical protein [Acidisoma silvae]MCB8876198.1 hypothetical protein [Acidisoma silvae]